MNLCVCARRVHKHLSETDGCCCCLYVSCVRVCVWREMELVSVCPFYCSSKYKMLINTCRSFQSLLFICITPSSHICDVKIRRHATVVGCFVCTQCRGTSTDYCCRCSVVVVSVCLLVATTIFWFVLSLFICIFLYCFVCQYQSSDWLWRPPPKWPRPYTVSGETLNSTQTKPKSGICAM